MEPPAPAYTGNGSDYEKHGDAKPYIEGNGVHAPGEVEVEEGQGQLKRSLHGRHMQMIAIGRPKYIPTASCLAGDADTAVTIGGAIGAGLFVGTGSALETGGPAGLVCQLLTMPTVAY